MKSGPSVHHRYASVSAYSIQGLAFRRLPFLGCMAFRGKLVVFRDTFPFPLTEEHQGIFSNKKALTISANSQPLQTFTSQQIISGFQSSSCTLRRQQDAPKESWGVTPLTLVEDNLVSKDDNIKLPILNKAVKDIPAGLAPRLGVQRTNANDTVRRRLHCDALTKHCTTTNRKSG